MRTRSLRWTLVVLVLGLMEPELALISTLNAQRGPSPPPPRLRPQFNAAAGRPALRPVFNRAAAPPRSGGPNFPGRPLQFNPRGARSSPTITLRPPTTAVRLKSPAAAAMIRRIFDPKAGGRNAPMSAKAGELKRVFSQAAAKPKAATQAKAGSPPPKKGLRSKFDGAAKGNPTPLGQKLAALKAAQMKSIGNVFSSAANHRPKQAHLANAAGNFSKRSANHRQATGNEIFYKYHGVHNRTGKTFNYITNKRYTSERELRNDMAILKEWGIKIDRVTTFRPAKGTWIAEGKAARQTGQKTGEVRAGGGYQAIIDTKAVGKSSIMRTQKLNW